MLPRRIKINDLTLVFLTLGSGYFVNFLGRPGPVIYFIHENLDHGVSIRPLHLEISNQVASYLYVYAIFLLSVVLINLCRTGVIPSSPGWITVEFFLKNE